MDVVSFIMATVADSPSAKQPREKSVMVLETLVMAAGDGWELGCQAAADGGVTDSVTEALQCSAVCSSSVPAGSAAECLLGWAQILCSCICHCWTRWTLAWQEADPSGPSTLQPLALLRESPHTCGLEASSTRVIYYCKCWPESSLPHREPFWIFLAPR